jgi:hypothetical protein
MVNSSMNHAKQDSSRRESPRSGYNPVTLEDVQGEAHSPLFEGLESTSSRTLAGLLFIIILIFSRNVLQLSGLLLLVLLVCVLYRMDKRERQIAAIPLAFSAIRIALQLALQSPFGREVTPSRTSLSVPPTLETALYWMPLLFAAYLFYSPWKNSHTSRLVFWYSLAMLLSGLLPGDGYLYISAILFYTLFVAMAIALIIDFSPEKPAEQRSPVVPREPAPPAQPAFS